MRMLLQRLAVLSAMIAPVVQAQDSLPSRLASQAMNALRLDGDLADARRILRPVNGAQSIRAQQDAMADSLTSYLLTHGDTPREQETGFSILLLLTSSGAGAGDGVPYRGAASRLTQLAEGSPRYAGGALSALAQLHHRRDGLSRLKAFAASAHPRAWLAIRVIVDLTGEEGLAELKDLHQRRLTHNAEARNLLEAIARERNWPAPGS